MPQTSLPKAQPLFSEHSPLYVARAAMMKYTKQVNLRMLRWPGRFHDRRSAVAKSRSYESNRSFIKPNIFSSSPRLF